LQSFFLDCSCPKQLTKKTPPNIPIQTPNLNKTNAQSQTGNILCVTEGPYEGKLALLDFGLVAEVPPADRAAMVSATIHLANRDWNGAAR
jgi:hypothetical protein